MSDAASQAQSPKKTMERPCTLSDVAFESAQKGDVIPALSLLRAGADPNAVDRHGFSALSRAAQFDSLDLIQALIAAGADVNAANRWGGTPLMIARSREAAEALLAAGASPDAVTIPNKTGLTAGQSALIQAAQMGRLPVVEALLAGGANRDLRDEDAASALLLAALNGHDVVAQALTEAGARVGPEEAAVLGDVAALEVLFHAGGEQIPSQAAMALWWAAGRGREATVALLLDIGANAEYRQHRGKTALIHAALRGRTETLQLLLRRGASVNAMDDGEQSALFWSQWAAQGRRVESVQALLVAGADVDQASKYGWTPLLAAALGGATDCAELLIQHGADVNAVNDFDEDGVGGYTALIYAIMNSRTAMVKLLIRSGADVNARGLGTRTPLEVARHRMGRPDFDGGICDQLAQAGAA